MGNRRGWRRERLKHGSRRNRQRQRGRRERVSPRGRWRAEKKGDGESEGGGKTKGMWEV